MSNRYNETIKWFNNEKGFLVIQLNNEHLPSVETQ